MTPPKKTPRPWDDDAAPAIAIANAVFNYLDIDNVGDLIAWISEAKRQLPKPVDDDGDAWKR